MAGFLYAVYEDRGPGMQGIYCHGSFEGEPGKGLTLAPPGYLPMERTASAAERSMVQRYAEEFRYGTYCI